MILQMLVVNSKAYHMLMTQLSSFLSLFGVNDTTHIHDNINTELDKISEWLKLNKLSLNINKTKVMMIHTPQKKIQITVISIENIAIECVDSFNFLGIYLDKYMNWKSQTDYIASKLSNSIGFLNRLITFSQLQLK